MTWDGLATRLEGRIVALEPLSPDHEEGLFRAAQGEDVWRWMPTDPSGSPEAFHAWMLDALDLAESGLHVPFTVLDQASGEPVGSSRFLTLRPEHRGLEIGYTWYARERWGSGVNVEAKLLLLRHAFETHGCLRVEFKTDARNERSRKALEALPATFEGVFRRHMLVQEGRVRDSAYYAVTDDDWPSVREALERRLEAK